MARLEEAPSPGRRKPGALGDASGSYRPGRSQTDIDISSVATGHAIPSTMVPTWDSVPDERKRLKVSPTPLIAQAMARRTHGGLLWGRIAVPPTANPRSKTSPTG